MSDTPVPSNPSASSDDGLLDDASLSDFERKLLEEFRPESTEAVAEAAETTETTESAPASLRSDDGAAAPPVESGVEPAGGATPPAVETDTPDPSELAGGEGGEVASSGEPSPPDPEPATESEPGLWDDFGDKAPEVERSARNLLDWYSQLTPEMVQQIDAVTSGQYTLIPTSQVPEINRLYEMAAQMQAQSQTQPVADGYEPDESDEPATPSTTDPEIERLRAQVNQLTEAQMQQMIHSEQQQLVEIINNARDEWVQDHPELTAEDIETIERDLIESGIYNPLADRYGEAEGMKRALDQTLYANATLRDRIIAARAAEQQALEQQAQRAQRASAIAGGATTPPANAPAATGYDDPIAAEIAQAMGRG